jgi:hypothetical protein
MRCLFVRPFLGAAETAVVFLPSLEWQVHRIFYTGERRVRHSCLVPNQRSQAAVMIHANEDV